MKHLMNFPLSAETLLFYPDLSTVCKEAGCDGLEVVWGGEALPSNVPQALHVGYHLTFFPDWLDSWLEDTQALERKFGAPEVWQEFYGGINGRETLLSLYRADLERAVAWGAEYVVFHVSDVSLEEGYTYQWLHTHQRVLEAAADVINCLLAGKEWPFAFLMENQWWPGLTLTSPAQTQYLLDAVHYENKGLLLDTGHLMNANLDLHTQEEAVAYIHRMLDEHGTLASQIRGIHLHQSLSGDYVKANTGHLPDGWEKEPSYLGRFSASYGHVLKIDRHEPFTCPEVARIVDQIHPEWLVHELSDLRREVKIARTKRQIRALEEGFTHMKKHTDYV